MNFNGQWLKKESEHYIFNYKKNSFAELHIDGFNNCYILL